MNVLQLHDRLRELIHQGFGHRRVITNDGNDVVDALPPEVQGDDVELPEDDESRAVMLSCFIEHRGDGESR